MAGPSYSQAMGRGVAASGGCPRLFELMLHGLDREGYWLTYEPSLIVPSVRHLHLHAYCTTEEAADEALLLCCGLVHMGYEHSLTLQLFTGQAKAVPRDCMRYICSLSDMRAKIT
jgi:hypothetical protein